MALAGCAGCLEQVWPAVSRAESNQPFHPASLSLPALLPGTVADIGPERAEHTPHSWASSPLKRNLGGTTRYPLTWWREEWKDPENSQDHYLGQY